MRRVASRSPGFRSLLLACLFLAGCGTSEKGGAKRAEEAPPENQLLAPAAFSQVLADASRKSVLAGGKAIPYMRAAVCGQPVDRQAAEAAYQEGLREMTEAAVAARQARGPSAASARQFQEALVRYLDGNVKRYSTHLREAFTAALNGNLSAAQKKAQIDAALNRSEREEQAEEAAARAAQQAFAAEFRITLRPPPPLPGGKEGSP